MDTQFQKNNTVATSLENHGVRMGLFIKFHEALSITPLQITARDYRVKHPVTELDEKMVNKWKTVFRGRGIPSDAMTILSKMYRLLLGDLCKISKIERKRKLNVVDWDKVNKAFCTTPHETTCLFEKTDPVSWLNRNYTIVYKDGAVNRDIFVPVKELWEAYTEKIKSDITIQKFTKVIRGDWTYAELYEKRRFRCDIKIYGRDRISCCFRGIIPTE